MDEHELPLRFLAVHSRAAGRDMPATGSDVRILHMPRGPKEKGEKKNNEALRSFLLLDQQGTKRISCMPYQSL